MSSVEKTRVGERVLIYPRGKKKIYVADFWQDGVHRKVSLKTPNKKVAIERATKIAADLHQGTFRVAPPTVDVEQAAAAYVAALETDGRARKTLVKYEGSLNIFIKFLGRMRITKLHQITGSVFDAWRTERRKVRRAKTVFTESVVVKQLMKWAKSRKLLHEDPLVGIKLNKPPLVPKAGPSMEEVNNILTTAEGALGNWLHVIAMTGMRVGELQRLRVEDIDLAGNWIHVRSRPGAETKTRVSRKIPIHRRLRAYLETLTPPASGWYFQAGISRKFPGGGNWINPKRVNDQFLELLHRLNLPSGRDHGYTIHSLRRFFETYCVNARVPQRVVDAWLGHHSDKSMAAVYYKLLDADSQSFMAEVPFEGNR